MPEPDPHTIQEFAETMRRLAATGVRFEDLGLSDEAVEFLRGGTFSIGKPRLEHAEETATTYKGPTNEAAYDRVRDFVLQAATSGREPRKDWRDAVHDAALDLDKIAYGAFAHPDSVSAAVTAMGSLAGIWLDVDEGDRLYLGETADE